MSQRLHDFEMQVPKSCPQDINQMPATSVSPPTLSRSSSYLSAFSGHTIHAVQSPSPQHKPTSSMDRLKQAILSATRGQAQNSKTKRSQRYHSRDQRDERKKWLALEKELHRAQGLASWSVQENDPESLSRLLRNLCDSLAEACYFLVDGSELPWRPHDQFNPFQLTNNAISDSSVSSSDGERIPGEAFTQGNSFVKPRYFVWPSAQAARTVILKEAIASARMNNPKSRFNVKPLVVLIAESSRSNLEDCVRLRGHEQESFVSGWTSASCGIAEVITAVVQSSNKMRNAIQAMLGEATQQQKFRAVLVCLHATMDSVVMSDVSSIRNICDSFGAYLCVEGSALAMIAQPGRPSDPDEAVSEAHFLLLDPGLWFGYKACAIISRHLKVEASRSQNTDSTGVRTTQSLYNDWFHNSDTCNLATGPALNLWTVISRVGVAQMRSRIDEVTSLAESFIHLFASSANIDVFYEGIGCIIRISYSLSREDRLMDRKKAAESISAVNKTIYAHITDESAAFGIHLAMAEDTTYLQLSPCRILCSGTFWIPKRVQVEEYVTKVQETVNRYESCKAGLVTFEERVARCRDLQLVTHLEGGSSLFLCFGAFRVVPFELGSSWRETSSSIDVVNHLTHQLVTQLSDSVGKTIPTNMLLQRELERLHFRAMKRLRSRQRTKGNSGNDLANKSQRVKAEEIDPDGLAIPFVFYMNSDLEDGVQDYVSVEPRQACRPVEAVRHSVLAADLAVEAVEAITSSWRRTNMISQIPRDLANITGKENFIPLAVRREDLGCSNYIHNNEGKGKSIVREDSEHVESDRGTCSESSENGFPSSAGDGSLYSIESEEACDTVDNISSINSISSQNYSVEEEHCKLRVAARHVEQKAQEDDLESGSLTISQEAAEGDEQQNKIAASTEEAYRRTDGNPFKNYVVGGHEKEPPPNVHMEEGRTGDSWFSSWTSRIRNQNQESKYNSGKHKSQEDLDENSCSDDSDEDAEENGNRRGEEEGEEEEDDDDNEDGADTSSSSSSSSTSSKSDDESGSDSEESGESTIADEISESVTLGSGTEITESEQESGAEKHEDNSKRSAGGYSSRFFRWLTQDGPPRANTENEGNGNDNDGRVDERSWSTDDEANTQLSEAASEWTSREFEMEEMSKYDGGLPQKPTESAEETKRTSSFGFGWLRRRYAKAQERDAEDNEIEENTVEEEESEEGSEETESESNGNSGSESGSSASETEEESEASGSEDSDESNLREGSGSSNGEESSGTSETEIESSETEDEDGSESTGSEGSSSSGYDESASGESSDEYDSSVSGEDGERQAVQEGRVWRYVNWIKPQWRNRSGCNDLKNKEKQEDDPSDETSSSDENHNNAAHRQDMPRRRRRRSHH